MSNIHLAVQHLFFIHTIVFSESYPFSPFLSNTEICIPARKCAIEAHHASARGKISLVSKNVNILITSLGSGYFQSNCQSWVFTNILCISLSLKERRWKALEASENSLDQSSRMWHLIIILVWWTFIITNILCSFVKGMAETHWPTLYWHYTAIWDLLHRWRDMSPSSGAKVALLWAVTFVPEWNFYSFLYLCCCYFFSFYVVLFSLWGLSSLHLCECLFWQLPHCC